MFRVNAYNMMGNPVKVEYREQNGLHGKVGKNGTGGENGLCEVKNFTVEVTMFMDPGKGMRFFYTPLTDEYVSNTGHCCK